MNALEHCSTTEKFSFARIPPLENQYVSKVSKKDHTTQRRNFLKTTAIAGVGASVPYFHWTPRTLADETKSKNDRITIGVIGAGGMAGGNMNAAKKWVDVSQIRKIKLFHT